jgi:hypothetical protein
MGYPETQDNFTPLVDGDDDVEAVNCNELQTAIEALEAMLGVSGASQAHNTDIIAHLMEELPTIRLSYVDADTVQASTGVSKPRKPDLSIRKFRKNTSTTNITGANLDTGAGSFANSTDYYVFAIGDASATTVTFKVTTSATTPASSTSYELIGGFSTNSSGDVIENTVWSLAAFKVKNFFLEKLTTVDTATTASNPMYLDNTKPQITEGKSLFSRDVFAQSSESVFVFFLIGMIFCDSGSPVIFALFKNSGADAVDATTHYIPNNTQVFACAFSNIAGSAGKKTFEIRYGPVSGGNTLHINGTSAGGQLFNGVASTLWVGLELGR